MPSVIECPCGALLRSDEPEDVVRQARQHAREVHEMDLSEEQARSMARPA